MNFSGRFILGKKDPRIDAYIAKSAEFARPVLTFIRKAVHAGCPEAEETLKWGFPHFMHEGILCSMASFKAHCAFGFWKGSLVLGRGEANADAMGQFGRITAVSDLPKEKELIRYVRKAAELNEAGVKAPTRSKAKPKKLPLRVPPYLQAALRRDEKAAAGFETFSPSHKREYIEWLTEAKTEETREKRLVTALEWMAEGKPRNWKYMRK